MYKYNWNSNATLLEKHERESIEAGRSVVCHRGKLYEDREHNVWLDTGHEHATLLGSVVEDDTPEITIESHDDSDVARTMAERIMAAHDESFARLDAKQAKLDERQDALMAKLDSIIAHITAPSPKADADPLPDHQSALKP
jgi:hypothetical protein